MKGKILRPNRRQSVLKTRLEHPEHVPLPLPPKFLNPSLPLPFSQTNRYNGNQSKIPARRRASNPTGIHHDPPKKQFEPG